MGEWKQTNLKTLIKFGNGKARPKTEGEIPIYGGNGVLGYSSETNYDGKTIIIGRVGAYCGATYFENSPIWISDNALSAKPKKNDDIKYLFYLLKDLDLNQHAQGSSHPLLTHTLLYGLEVNVTSNIDEQNAIADVLSCLDDKIDLLHRQNKTLEALAETLFRYTFIDNAQDDWEEKLLAEVLTVKGGATPSTKIEEFWGGDVLWTTPRDLSNNQQMYLYDTARKITEKGLAKISSGLLPAGTLLLSSRAPVGYLAFSVNPIAINQGYIAIIDDKGFSKNYIYLWLKLHMDYVKSHANGSTFQEISKTSFKKLKMICSPQSFRDKFEEHIKPLFNKIEANSHQIISLENIRDTLLPKLMSGDIRVKYDETSQTEAA